MILARTCGPHGPDMWPGQPGHAARTARTCGPRTCGPDGRDMWPRTARTRGPDGPDTWPGRPGHVARTARTCGPDSPDMWPDGRSPGCPGWVLRGKRRVGGFGWLLKEDVFGASMVFFAFEFLALRGWGGVEADA